MRNNTYNTFFSKIYRRNAFITYENEFLFYSSRTRVDFTFRLDTRSRISATICERRVCLFVLRASPMKIRKKRKSR